MKLLEQIKNFVTPTRKFTGPSFKPALTEAERVVLDDPWEGPQLAAQIRHERAHFIDKSIAEYWERPYRGLPVIHPKPETMKLVIDHALKSPEFAGLYKDTLSKLKTENDGYSEARAFVDAHGNDAASRDWREAKDGTRPISSLTSRASFQMAYQFKRSAGKELMRKIDRRALELLTPLLPFLGKASGELVTAIEAEQKSELKKWNATWQPSPQVIAYHQWAWYLPVFFTHDKNIPCIGGVSPAARAASLGIIL